ncbi:MAG: hypothetical protein K6A61_12740 [Butyrivibrio sp.]|jgi:hypothetical protein|uniref:Uncharacterized protein n=1 Tax=Butyrivibrio hungatei TaxID=185008 RepID=A0A1G5EY35_9FIRM|nr:hypothetical protein [Butyrivibrio hungatei]MBQ4218462.1 hypothetical protein [Butyrivibrio sp.]MCR4998150.1 hypothetical protein [Butyrivibrio sp.]SCY31338.1 hypothetical protein SAMN02910451_02128 [Butyrivibrio hungatei]
MSHEYLSDEELQKLIMDVELNDMTKAPANLQKKVLDAVDAADKAGNIAKTKKQKIIEYRLYSLKVALAVAAAIVVMFIVPGVPVANRDFCSMDKTDFQRDVSFRDEILKKKDDIKSKIYSIFAGDVEVDDGI